MRTRDRSFRVAVALDETSPSSTSIFEGILDLARLRGWRLGDETTAADADGVIADCAAAADGGIVATQPAVTFSAGLDRSADIQPDLSQLRAMAAEHFRQRGFATFHEDPADWYSLLKARRPGRPLAFWMSSDADAAAVIRAAGPDAAARVAVLGSGNDVLTCERCDPPLSSIDIGPRQLGRRAAGRLDRLLRRKPVPAVDLVPALGVVDRASTDMLAIDDEEIAVAVRFIREHAIGPLRVGDIVRAVSLDRRTLERRFRKALGRTPAEALRRYRVDRAAQLLRTTSQPMTEVAVACGFRLPQHLAAAFKLLHGQTPSDYRDSQNRV